MMSDKWKHKHSGCLCSADGCCVEFRMASCGQDSQLKIWIVSQREGAGRLTLLFNRKLSRSIIHEREREREKDRQSADSFNLEISAE